jgi:hypothetical protein
MDVRAPVRFWTHEQCVVGAGDVELGAAFHTPVAAEQRRSLLIQFGPLRLGENFLVRVLGGALQGRVGFVGPNALQIGFAPGRFQSWVWRSGGGRTEPDPTSR